MNEYILHMLFHTKPCVSLHQTHQQKRYWPVSCTAARFDILPRSLEGEYDTPL